jgi:hypothetical protein
MSSTACVVGEFNQDEVPRPSIRSSPRPCGGIGLERLERRLGALAWAGKLQCAAAMMKARTRSRLTVP